MVEFNELRLSDDRSELILDLDVVDDVQTRYIDSIYVEYYRNRSALVGVPSDKAEEIYKQTDPMPKLRTFTMDVIMDNFADDFGTKTWKGGLFYVYVIIKDSADEDYMVSEIGAVPDWQAVYEIGMQYVADITHVIEKCISPITMEYEQFTIAFHALEYALEAQDLDMMDRMWSRLFVSGTGNVSSNLPCGC